MILAHIMGIPVEETLLQLGGTAVLAAFAFAGRARLERVLSRRKRR